MSIYRHNIDVDYLIKEHAAGRAVGNLAREFGVTHKVIKARLEKAGIKTRSTTALELPEEEIVSMYSSGVSENKTAKHFGIERNVVRRLLKKHKCHIRNQSEAEALKWEQMTPTKREAQVKKAHDASRGRKASFDELCKRATSKASVGGFDSWLEEQMFNMLVKRGFSPICQNAVGPYNCDITVNSVAVEIWGGGFHFYGSHADRTPDRIRYLFDSGYDVIVITTMGGHDITEETADCVVRFIEASSSNPSAIRQYRVIRGAGELLAACSSDSDAIPVKPSFCGSFDF